MARCVTLLSVQMGAFPSPMRTQKYLLNARQFVGSESRGEFLLELCSSAFGLNEASRRRHNNHCKEQRQLQIQTYYSNLFLLEP